MNDDQFLAAFEARTLDEFHHRDHIKVAYLYLRRYPLEDAITKVRTGLQALAVAWGAPVDDLEKGYHETVTQAWVRLVDRALSDAGAAESADAFCDQQPKLMEKHIYISIIRVSALPSGRRSGSSSNQIWPLLHDYFTASAQHRSRPFR